MFETKSLPPADSIVLLSAVLEDWSSETEPISAMQPEVICNNLC